MEENIKDFKVNFDILCAICGTYLSIRTVGVNEYRDIVSVFPCPRCIETCIKTCVENNEITRKEGK